MGGVFVLQAGESVFQDWHRGCDRATLDLLQREYGKEHEFVPGRELASSELWAGTNVDYLRLTWLVDISLRSLQTETS